MCNSDAGGTGAFNELRPGHTVPYSLHHVWTRVLHGDGGGGTILEIHVQLKGKPFLAYVG